LRSLSTYPGTASRAALFLGKTTRFIQENEIAAPVRDKIS